MKELIEKIKTEMETFSKDADAQLTKGNKAAGTRARKSALELSIRGRNADRHGGHRLL